MELNYKSLYFATLYIELLMRKKFTIFLRTASSLKMRSDINSVCSKTHKPSISLIDINEFGSHLLCFLKNVTRFDIPIIEFIIDDID